MAGYPIPDDWTGEYCRFSVCWPNSVKWKAILRGLCVEPTVGWFWDATTGDLMETLGIIRETLDYNLQNEEVIVACNDAGLSEIAAALRLMASQQGCCVVNVNGGVQGSVSDGAGGVIPIIGSQPGGGLDPDTFPEGYANLEDYLLDKCRMANLIVDGLISTLQTLAGFDLLNMGGLAGLFGLSLFGVIVIPEVAIPVIVAALAVLAVLGSTLIAAAGYISDNRQDFVCAIYQGDSAEIIIATLADLFDALIAFLDVSTPVGIAIKTVLVVLVGPDTVNKVFTNMAGVGYPDADCSTCGVNEIVIARLRGEITFHEGNDYEFTSDGPHAPGFARLAFVSEPATDPGTQCFHIVDFTLTGYNAATVPAVAIWYAGDLDYTVLATGVTESEIEAALVGFDVVDVDIATDFSAGTVDFTATMTVSAC